jgi:hypothetical protein
MYVIKDLEIELISEDITAYTGNISVITVKTVIRVTGI